MIANMLLDIVDSFNNLSSDDKFKLLHELNTLLQKIDKDNLETIKEQLKELDELIVKNNKSNHIKHIN